MLLRERPYAEDSDRALAALNDLCWSQGMFHGFITERGRRADIRDVRRWFSGTRPFPPELLAWLLRVQKALNEVPERR
jgi:hypothetical protein